MAGPDEKDLDAAERALGTAPREGETAEQRRDRQGWEALLAPLALAAPPAEPPADMLERIERGLDGDKETAKIIQLAERRARRWRAVAIATSGMAACLLLVVGAALFLLSDRLLTTPPAAVRNYVALMTPEGGGPGMTVNVSYGDQEGTPDLVTIDPYQVNVPEGRALELWQVPPEGTPNSLGLIDLSNPMHAISASLQAGDTLAVSVEPPGGSPTGIPTGPVILSGPLIETR